MTKPVTRKMAVDCLLDRVGIPGNVREVDGVLRLICKECDEPLLPGQAIQFDHIHADKLGGPHTYDALRPVHYDPCHKAKNGRDVAALAKIDRITGVTGKGPKTKMRSRPFSKAARPFPKRKRP